ncbi:hypothetical protein FHR24_001266 [Wenyingzhuangia heitensis]|uniref:Secretion system C-terminal sorting domain-containing protein n=1 Tax=Wenyingzhuangia heitensis TaxID=1487859 RepID=A0ABX0U7I9_9FLAO|nr:T9SS type A sorting domain-containing protein [Wenyingzhuangia heitensis]NIJ44827.1 hypothetical protein [Wenyingzhuangia heitensis]
MKNKITQNIFLLSLLLTISVFAQDKINILDTNYYGFEVSSGDDGWWMQQPENFSIATNKGAEGSSNSLKYTNSTSFTGSKKAFGSTTISDMLIDLDPGTYTVKAMIWLESGTDISAIKVNFRTDSQNDTNAVLDLSSIVKDKWVAVSVSFTTTYAFANTNIRILMDSSYGGIGTLYLDDLQLLKDISEEVLEIPFQSQIETTESENITMDKGSYNISLQVFVDENTTISNFYTQVLNPWVTLKWDISSIAKNEWVQLSQKMILSKEATNSTFRFQVNNQPEFGGGKGTFYVDELKIEKAEEAELSVGELLPNRIALFTPNPTKDYINFSGAVGATVEIYNSLGKKVKAFKISNLGHRENVSNLSSGVFYVKIYREKETIVKQLIIH